MTIFQFAGAKGGVGTTVHACSTARMLLDNHRSVLVFGDLRAITAYLPTCHVDTEPRREPSWINEVRDGVTICPIIESTSTFAEIVTLAEMHDIAVVIDRGLDLESVFDHGIAVLCTELTYIGLHMVQTRDTDRFDALIVLVHPGATLDRESVRTSTGFEPVIVERDAIVARAIDAGMLIDSQTKNTERYYRNLRLVEPTP